MLSATGHRVDGVQKPYPWRRGGFGRGRGTVVVAQVPEEEVGQEGHIHTAQEALLLRRRDFRTFCFGRDLHRGVEACWVLRGFAREAPRWCLMATSRTPHDTRALFARARRPPRSMAGCALVCSVRPTLADGRRADGPKAVAVAARARTSFIVQTCSSGSFTTRALRPRA